MARALVRPARAINSVVRYQQITETEIEMTTNHIEERRYTAQRLSKLWVDADQLVFEAGEIVRRAVRDEVQLANDKKNPRNIKFDLNNELRDVAEKLRINFMLDSHYTEILDDLDELIAEEQK
jgi:type IV secretory pathway ATPase VirB11/archaellum biosynthesis ATPase